MFSVLIRFVVIAEFIALIYLMISIIGKYRYVPLILYFSSLILMLLAVLFDTFGYLGVNIEVSIVGRNLDVIDYFFTEFVILAVITWGLSLHFVDYDKFTWPSLALVMIGSGVTVGEILETSKFANIVNLILEVAGLFLFAYIVINHYIKSRWGLRLKAMRTFLMFYIIGFLILIVMGLISLVSVALYPETEATLGHLWVLGLGTSLFMSGLLLVKYPTILLINISRPKRFILATMDGTPIISFGFISTEKSDLDPEVIGSALSGVSSLLKTIVGVEVPLKTISFGEYHIMVFMSRKLVGYLFVENPSRILRESMSRITEELEEMLSSIVEEGLVVLTPKVLSKVRNKIMEIFPYVEQAT